MPTNAFISEFFLRTIYLLYLLLPSYLQQPPYLLRLPVLLYLTYLATEPLACVRVYIPPSLPLRLTPALPVLQRTENELNEVRRNRKLQRNYNPAQRQRRYLTPFIRPLITNYHIPQLSRLDDQDRVSNCLKPFATYL